LWAEADEMSLAGASPFGKGASIPTRRELLDRYADRTGRDLSPLPWYVGFGCFKLAVVCAGVAARGRAGAMIGEGFIEMAQRIAPLVAIGHDALDGNLR
jgi:aminoglycoside phosphotransferase (APT) family kinase protein